MLPITFIAQDIPSPSSIENSQLAVTLGAVLLWVIIGFVAMWVFSAIAKHVEVLIIPRIPFIIAAGALGLLVIGMFKSCGH